MKDEGAVKQEHTGSRHQSGYNSMQHRRGGNNDNRKMMNRNQVKDEGPGNKDHRQMKGGIRRARDSDEENKGGFSKPKRKGDFYGDGMNAEGVDDWEAPDVDGNREWAGEWKKNHGKTKGILFIEICNKKIS